MRIDHVLYKHSNQVKVDTLQWFTCLSNVPGLNGVSYSDHEGVCVEFAVCPAENPKGICFSSADNGTDVFKRHECIDTDTQF